MCSIIIGKLSPPKLISRWCRFYYEVALKSKYSRDGEALEMLDVIHDGVVFNFPAPSARRASAGPGAAYPGG